MASAHSFRLAVDIGGTFTDVALDTPRGRITGKVLTTPEAPERAVMEGLRAAAAKAACAVSDIGFIIHGTTLATNALIERKGARTALITTEGFRDSVEIGYEHRFEQYDIQLEKPQPLVPRSLRYPVPERVSATGAVLRALDLDALEALIPVLVHERIESIAVGFLHSYANPAHEQRVRDVLLHRLPQMHVTLSCEVSPELREYERLSTACANAYVQPMMAGYLDRLAQALRAKGFAGELLLMTSGGGVIGVEAARQFPIRLVESGPAGGAILASRIALECGLEHVLSFDMGGTTAKICLIDHGEPQASRAFEVARAYRFLKGSGLPLRIPVIEMVEIGAGGGSIARVDLLKRVAVGPDSAGAAPGPACYGRGGSAPTVTDADLVLGRIDPRAFAAGQVHLDTEAATAAITQAIGAPLDLPVPLAASAIIEIVDENMASAARVHAVERGKSLEERTLIAFGGAAPLHASRVAAKLGIERIVVPAGAGVGSAVGMLTAAVAYEVARTLYQRVRDLDPAAVNTHIEAMRHEAQSVVQKSAGDTPLVESRTAYMRYIGQGHEIAVQLEARALDVTDRERLHIAFENEYRKQFGRIIPGLEAEILSWAMELRTLVPPPKRVPAIHLTSQCSSSSRRSVFDPETGKMLEADVFRREALEPGASILGPALIVEDETTTVVAAGWRASVNAARYLVLERQV